MVLPPIANFVDSPQTFKVFERVVLCKLRESFTMMLMYLKITPEAFFIEIVLEVLKGILYHPCPLSEETTKVVSIHNSALFKKKFNGFPLHKKVSTIEKLAY